jgi:hypothetical protein
MCGRASLLLYIQFALNLDIPYCTCYIECAVCIDCSQCNRKGKQSQVPDNEDGKPVKRTRGGAVKTAPPGYYTAKEAQKRLGFTPSTFNYYVRMKRIARHVPPLRKEGFYSKKEIDLLANELALFLHTGIEDATEVRPARPEDAEGVVSVLAVMGWRTTTAEQRLAWYKVNPYVDFVALSQSEVMGYIHAVPFKPEALEAIMSGKRRSWDMTPADILPYQSGTTYDIYIGIATRQDVPNHTHRFGFRLISGFLDFLEELAAQNILIRHIYAVSAEPDGQKLSRSIGFVEQPAQEGDLFPRFMIDMENSNSHFAKRYREAIKRAKELN